jgi:hypothetical protein
MLNTFQAWVAQAVLPYRAKSYSAAAHERLRLNVLIVIAVLKLFNFFGGNWDIQWHVAIGRDSLFIPPHLMVMVAYVCGLATTLAWIAYETSLARNGVMLQGAARLGSLRAPLAYFGIMAGYTGALLSAFFDEYWHRTFGIDATLWSPPHLCIMATIMLVDLSLMIGITTAARRSGLAFTWRSPFLWGLALASAYSFEAVNFQMNEAFIVGFRAGGAGLMGILFPVMVGAFFPLALLLSIRLSRHFWIAALLFVIALALQFAGTGIAQAGFDILKPVSKVEEFVRLNPESTLAKARQFAMLIGFTGLIGFQQAWAMSLAAVPLGLVSLLEVIPWARCHPLVAAPVFSLSMVLISYLWFQRIPVLRGYGVTWQVVALGVVLSVVIGLAFGRLGLFLADRFGPQME